MSICNAIARGCYRLQSMGRYPEIITLSPSNYEILEQELRELDLDQGNCFNGLEIKINRSIQNEFVAISVRSEEFVVNKPNLITIRIEEKWD